ncbi:MAG: methylmalonyl-CoA mutase family protein [Actinomycetota bacterium]|nr:methylmalonyl-CoA mutase family protein [Actinomycetota bacterium]
MATEEPGKYPYTRGINADPGVWTMGQYGGFGTPAETNERFRLLLDQGLTGFSVALDLPTQLGLDSDNPLSLGEVGRIGVAIDSLRDIEILMEGIPLEKITQVRTTANSIGYIWAAMFIALAEQREMDPNKFGMFIQNDVLKEYIARGTQIFPAEAGLKLSVDVIEYIATKIPRWVSLAMSGYHIRESGSDAVQEVAFTFANAREYLDAAIARGVSVDQIAATLFTFLSSNIEFLPEIAKFRAARKTWARLIHEKYEPKDAASEKLRIFAFTAGSSLTAQQSMNNIVRTSVEMLAAALGGIQTMHVSAFDEALGVPTEEAAMLALRTQQVIAFETGVLNTADPLAGSYELERLTDELAEKMWAMLEDIQKRGGAMACINNGWFSSELSDKAYKFAMSIESGERKLVGVNLFKADTPPYKAFEINPASEAGQVAALKQVRTSRDNKRVAQTLSDLQAAAQAGENIMDTCIAAVKAYATVGEIVDELRKVYGKWIPTRAF